MIVTVAHAKLDCFFASLQRTVLMRTYRFPMLFILVLLVSGASVLLVKSALAQEAVVPKTESEVDDTGQVDD